jgi:hypothetical protein
MTLGNMRKLGVHRLVATCLNGACRHQGLIDVSKFAHDVEMPFFAAKVVCAKCGARGRHIDMRPNWKEQAERPSLSLFKISDQSRRGFALQNKYF